MFTILRRNFFLSIALTVIYFFLMDVVAHIVCLAPPGKPLNVLKCDFLFHYPILPLNILIAIITFPITSLFTIYLNPNLYTTNIQFFGYLAIFIALFFLLVIFTLIFRSVKWFLLRIHSELLWFS